MLKWSDVRGVLEEVGLKDDSILERIKDLVIRANDVGRPIWIWEAALEACGRDVMKARALCWLEARSGGTGKYRAFKSLLEGSKADDPLWVAAFDAAAGYCSWAVDGSGRLAIAVDASADRPCLVPVDSLPLSEDEKAVAALEAIHGIVRNEAVLYEDVSGYAYGVVGAVKAIVAAAEMLRQFRERT